MGLMSCDDPKRAQALSDALSAEKIDALLRKWSSAAAGKTSGVWGKRNSDTGKVILHAITDEKANAANHIARAADSRFGGVILRRRKLLKSLVGAQGLEPWTR